MTLWDYLSIHPWWGLAYLCVISGSLQAVVLAARKEKKSDDHGVTPVRKGPSILVETKHE